MGPVFVNLAVVAIVAFAFALLAAAATTPGPPYPVTAAAEIIDTGLATSNPIRTVVTVNSNRVDVLAADEKDVPKVLEKLRELCAGPFASLYPEICEHIGAGGKELDIDGLDEIIWGSSEGPTRQIATSTSNAVAEQWPEPPSARPLSTSLAEETGSTEGSQSPPPTVSESAPAGPSIPLLVTLTVPAEIKTTKTEEVVHEVPETASGLSASATVDNEEASTVAKSQVPTTLETKIKPSSVETIPSDAEKGTAETVPVTNPNNESDKAISTSDKSEEDNKDDSEMAAATTNINGKSEEPVATEAKSETDKAISTTMASGESAKASPITNARSRPETSALTSSAKDESKEAITSTDAQGDPETVLECPWKTGDEGDDESPGPCTVITIWHYGTLTLPPGFSPTHGFTLGPSNSEFRPVFTPTASPRPSRTRTSFDVTLPSPPPSTDSPPLWFATPGIGCTQTVSLVPRINDPFTSTIYPETFTSTAFISCSCPNLVTEYIVRNGIVILPRTTVSALEPTTTKVVQCSASTPAPPA